MRIIKTIGMALLKGVVVTLVLTLFFVIAAGCVIVSLNFSGLPEPLAILAGVLVFVVILVASLELELKYC